MKPNFHIGLKINELRKRQRLTKKDFMLALDKTPSLFNKWEVLPDTDTGVLRDICEKFNIGIEFFFHESKTKNYQISQSLSYVSENSDNFNTQNVITDLEKDKELEILRNDKTHLLERIHTLERLVNALEKIGN
jgi:hypothetical protein